MSTPAADRQPRIVRLETLHGTIEGALRISPMLRTLDDLNMLAKGFLTIHDLQFSTPDWSFSDGPVMIRKNSVLWVVELSEPPRRPGGNFAGRFSRSPLRLRVGSFDLEGFVHVPPGGSPMTRLNQDTHPFVALTSVSIVCDDSQFAAPFIAVNRHQILAAQEMDAPHGDLVMAHDAHVDRPAD